MVRGLSPQSTPRESNVGVAHWARDLIEHAEVDIVTRGLENLAPGGVYVVMSNHRSLYDIPVALHALRIPMRMVAKTELFSIPIMGGGMRGAGFIAINRENGRAALRSLDEARETMLRYGISVWIAPEGTRSNDRSLGEFKRGGFMLAWHADIPILPVSMEGTETILRARGVRVTRGQRVDVTIGEPVAPREYKRQQMPELMARVRESIAAPLGLR